MSENSFSFKIYIVFDNKCIVKDFLAGFGFSALIYNNFTKNYLLFDTGGNAEVLVYNLKKFNVNVLDIKKIIISHNHHDHTGGLDGIYRLNSELEIYIPQEHALSYRRHYLNSTIISVENFFELENNVYSSGQLGEVIKEQALFLKTKDDKIIIIVGCTHPGLENFIVKAREIGKVIAVIGGFHGFQKYSYLNDINIIGACHCTSHISDIKKRFPNQFKEVCVGTHFSF
jgi:7,8-dihydropterin-6-yl-methyl-4-(beta-D-ribofuranosyl)aminobenzene 5'-phosphate synthase